MVRAERARTERTRTAVEVAATVTTGLLAGLYFAYACSVMPGLGRTDDATFTAAMTNINDAIVNPVFMLAFAGAPLLTAVLAWQRGGIRGDRRVLAALVLHVVAFGLTSAVSVPLNDELARTGDRDAFENAWVAWNIVRTVAVTGALTCLAVAGSARGAARPEAATAAPVEVPPVSPAGRP
jgi:uncharacterized membrane protein